MAQIHASAIVDPKAELASDVIVGPYCIIGPNVKAGKGTEFKSHVVVEGHTTIGEGNTFFPFSVIGAVPQDLKYKGEPTELIIGDHNLIRESVTLNIGTVQGGGKTVMGSHNLVMAYVHFGHDTVVGNHCIMANGVTLAGHVIIEDHVNIGGLVGVIQFLRMGTHSYIGAGSTVERDVPPYSIVVGERPCEMKGTNIVGLRRKGYKNDVITAINESLKLWRRPEVLKEQCLIDMEAQYGQVEEVKGLIAFIRKSENGCVK